jgi:hypothetical protein
MHHVSPTLFVCTHEHLLRVQSEDRSWAAEPVLEGVEPQCVAADGARVIVGTRGRGAFVSVDAGASWDHVELPENDVFSVAIGGADGALYAGTEPSRLFVAQDGGPWAELEALQEIPSRDRWSFPPRPGTHHVRWIAPDPHRAERLLVGIELGGLMYSDDGGASFSDHRPGALLDTHSIAWHPRVQDRAYQAAGDGAAWSRDGGRTWEAADANRELGYRRSHGSRTLVRIGGVGSGSRAPPQRRARAAVSLAGLVAGASAARRVDALRAGRVRARAAGRNARRADPAQRRRRRELGAGRRAPRADRRDGFRRLSGPGRKFGA